MSDDVEGTMTTFDLQFDPIDWQQLELLAKLTPGERMRASVMAHEFATALLRGTLRRRFPDLSLAELNMMVLRHCTEVRGMDP
jgi:hypothetical protein